MPAARSVRLRFVSEPRRQQSAWWLGITAVAIAMLLALDSRWAASALAAVVAAALLWLGGIFVLPWTRDGYGRRVVHAFDDWWAGGQWAYDHFAHRRAKLTRRLETFTPPPGFETQHSELTDVVAESERLSADRSIAFAERSREVTAAAQNVDRILDELSAAATTDAQRRYVASLADVIERRRSAYAEDSAKAEQSTRDVIRKLTRIRPPAAAAAEHDELIRAFERYLEAAQDYHAAGLARQPDRVAAAAQRIAAAQGDLRSAYEAIATRLDHSARWPTPGAESSTGE